MTTQSEQQLSEPLAAVCRSTYPGVLRQRVLDLERISDGWECDVYRFDLEGDERGAPLRRELILRIYLGRGAAPKAEHEFRVLRTLDAARYPVPRVDAVVAQDSPLGQPLTLMERVDGAKLGDVMLQAESAAERERYLGLFCGLMVELHRLDWKPFVPDPDRFHPEDAASRWVDGIRGLARSVGVSDYDEALDWLAEHAAQVRPHGLSLVHWDFHPWNVLLRPDGRPAVIDWTSADVSDPRFDLAWTLLLVQAARGPALRDAVLAEYERLAGSISDLPFFEAAVSLRRIASMVISLSLGSEVFGMRAGAEEQMRDNLGHLTTAYALFRERTGLRLPVAEAVLR